MVPSSLGIEDATLNGLITQLIQAQLEMKTIQDGIGENPLINLSKEKIKELRSNILENLNNLKNANDISIAEVDKRLSVNSSSLRGLPTIERNFVNIQRMYELSETLYRFLMEKKAEAGISKSSASSDIVLVDPAMIEGDPIKPQVLKNYLFAIIIGLLFPLGYAYVSEIFDNKIRTREDIDQYSEIPFIGMVGHSSSQNDFAIEENSKSFVTESFRTVRSNIQYLLNGKSPCKVFLSYLFHKAEKAKHIARKI